MAFVHPFCTTMNDAKPINIDSDIKVEENAGHVIGTQIGADANNQHVNVTVNNPDLNNLNSRELQLMIVNVMERGNAALQSLEVRYYELKKAQERKDAAEAKERRERQQETDQHRIHLNSRIDHIEERIEDRTSTLLANITSKIERIETWILVIFIAIGIIFFILMLALFLFVAFRMSVTSIFPWVYIPPLSS